MPTTTKKKPVVRAPKEATAPAVSDQTLERLPLRAVTFLMAIGTIPEVRARLAERGYNDSVHQSGWTLLEQVGGRASLAPPVIAPESDEPDGVDAALQSIESWAGPNFTVAEAALEHSYPAQHVFVFADGLKAARGSKGVLAVQTLLSRLDRLGDKRRGETDETDGQKALDLLATRGITPAERARVRSLVETVQRGSKAKAAPVAASTSGASGQAAKQKLYAWYGEWSSIARAVVKRRDHLIRLGLSARRKPAKKTG